MPVAVSAFTEDVILRQGIVDLTDVGKFVPNLTVTGFSAGHTSSVNPFIRGIGLQDHLKRLFGSASIYRIPTPYSLDERHAACRETVKASGLKSAYLRPVVFRGDCGPGVIPKNMSVVDVAIMLAADLGLQVQEKPISREQMYAADEMFFTGTAVEVTPVKQLDHLKAGTGTKGLVTTTLQSAFFGLFDGRTTDQRGWLEPLWTRP